MAFGRIFFVLLLTTGVDSFWYSLDTNSLNNGFGALTGLSGWNGSFSNYKLQFNKPCSFCSKTNSYICCLFRGSCCNNEIPVCIPNIQCRLSQKCNVSSDTFDYCSLYGCCRLNATDCCPQLAATLPFEPFVVVVNKDNTTSLPNNYYSRKTAVKRSITIAPESAGQAVPIPQTATYNYPFTPIAEYTPELPSKSNYITIAPESAGQAVPVPQTVTYNYPFTPIAEYTPELPSKSN